MRIIRNMLNRRPIAETAGVTAIEYGLIAALIAVGIITMGRAPVLAETKALVGFCGGGLLSLLGALGGARDDGHSKKTVAAPSTAPTTVMT